MSACVGITEGFLSQYVQGYITQALYCRIISIAFVTASCLVDEA